MPDPAIHGYVLAGGQSSRMGTDKALLPFGTSTLLGQAVAALHPFCRDVTLVGRTSAAVPDCRVVPDVISLAGPVAGVTTALIDLAARGGTWAFFLPVDVPLLPGALLQALSAHWCRNPLTRIAFPIAEERPQPVISLVHITALPMLRHSLELDQRRLRPALEHAAAQLAKDLAAPLADVLQTPVLTIQNDRTSADYVPLNWQPSPEQLKTSHLWFANANTPAELDQLRASLASSGSQTYPQQ